MAIIKEEKISFIARIVLILIVAELIIFFLFVYGAENKYFDFIISDEGGKLDIRNWAAMMVSIIAGTVIAFIISYYDTHTRKRLGDILKKLEDRDNTRISKQQRELVTILVRSRESLQSANNILNNMDGDKRFELDAIQDIWDFLSNSSQDGINDVLISSSDILDQDLVTELRIIKGQLKSNFTGDLTIDSVSSILQQLQIIIERVLNGPLNSARTDLIAEMTSHRDELLNVARERNASDVEITQIGLWHNAEIRRFSINDQEE